MFGKDNILKELKLTVNKRKNDYNVKLTPKQKFSKYIREINKFLSLAKEALLEICNLKKHFKEYSISFEN